MTATLSRLRAEAAAAAAAGLHALADNAELLYIRATQAGVTRLDGSASLGVPARLVRGYGPAGRLAVEWSTIDGTIFTDTDGKEINCDQADVR